MTGKQRYLVASLGSIGLRHLRNLRSLRPESVIAVWRRTAGDPPAEADLQFSTREEVREFGPAAAIIAGPASSHVVVADQLMQLGAAIFMEKPIAHSLEGVNELVARSRALGTIFMVAYNLRFRPDIRHIKDLLESNKIGQIVSARAEVGQYLPDWRPNADYRTGVSARSDLGGGALLELSHELDYLTWFFGLPKRVTARGGKFSALEIDVEDLVEILLEYDSPKRLVSVHLDLLQRAPYRAARLVGTAGTVVWDAGAERVDCFRTETSAWETQTLPLSDRNAMYVDELRHFLDCLEDGNDPLITGEQAADVLSIVAAARRSMDDGRTIEVHRRA